MSQSNVAVQPEIRSAWLLQEEFENPPLEIISSRMFSITGLTYEGRTFTFSRPLSVRLLEGIGGWVLQSNTPKLMDFGETWNEAELAFRSTFSFCWDEYACEDDKKLAQDAQEFKRELLALVKAVE